MFRTLFLIILLVTLTVNIIFLFASKEKPPDSRGGISSTLPASELFKSASTNQRRLVLRSNDFYDYLPSNGANDESMPNRIQVYHQKEIVEVATNSIDEFKSSFKSPHQGDNGNELSQPQQAKTSKSQWAKELAKRKRGEQQRQQQQQQQQSDDKSRQKTLFLLPSTTFAYDFNDNYNDDQPDETNSAKGIEHEPSLGPTTTTTIAATILNQALPLATVTDNGNQLGDNKIESTRRKSQQEVGWPKALKLRVKSSKNHVLISLDDSIIYESGVQVGPTQHPHSRLNGFSKRRKRRQHQPKSQQQQQPVNNNANEALEEAQKFETTDGDDTEASRGIHVLVLNQHDGSIMARRIFDTYSPQQDQQLALFLNMIQDGRILVLAIRDEGSFKMPKSSPARKILQSLGSRHIQDLGWRDMWAMVTVLNRSKLLETNGQVGEQIQVNKRKATSDNTACLAEAHSKSIGFSQWAEPVLITAQIQLDGSEVKRVELNNCFSNQTRRFNFCSRVEGFGRVCDCRPRFESPIDFHPKPIENSLIDQVPIVVIASNRPYYLYRMLRSLLQVDGLNSSMVTVFIDGFNEEPAEVCKLFNLRYIQHRPLATRSARISNHYKTSLGATFQRLFPQAKHAIIFEEDLDIAPDALIYFNQTLPILMSDKSLYCVSAWNDQGYEHSIGDLSQVYRIETMPGLGWMLSRSLFVDELQPNWPDASQQHDWDMWIRTNAIRRDRECLIPDISRTFHFGSVGTNINSYFQRQYFSNHAFSGNYLESTADSGATKFRDLTKLTDIEYDSMLEQILSDESRYLDSQIASSSHIISDPSSLRSKQREFLCSLANFTYYFNNLNLDGHEQNNIGDNLEYDNINSVKLASLTRDIKSTTVISIKMIDKSDFKNWLKLAKCWHLWDLDARGQHKSTWRLYLSGKPILIVGHPASPFSKFKPNKLVPFDLN